MSLLQNSHWSLRGKRKKIAIQIAALQEHHSLWIRYRTDKVVGWKKKKNHDCRFVLASNYRFASLAEIVLWYSVSLSVVAMVPNATGTGAYLRQIWEDAEAQAFCMSS